MPTSLGGGPPPVAPPSFSCSPPLEVAGLRLPAPGAGGARKEVRGGRTPGTRRARGPSLAELPGHGFELFSCVCFSFSPDSSAGGPHVAVPQGGPRRGTRCVASQTRARLVGGGRGGRARGSREPVPDGRGIGAGRRRAPAKAKIRLSTEIPDSPPSGLLALKMKFMRFVDTIPNGYHSEFLSE